MLVQESVSWLFLLSDPLSENSEQKENEDHCGDHKVILTEQQKTKQSAAKANEGRDMVFRSLPLIDENDNEQRGQNKVQPILLKLITAPIMLPSTEPATQ